MLAPAANDATSAISKRLRESQGEAGSIPGMLRRLAGRQSVGILQHLSLETVWTRALGYTAPFRLGDDRPARHVSCRRLEHCVLQPDHSRDYL